jgi:hypothetical protein
VSTDSFKYTFAYRPLVGYKVPISGRLLSVSAGCRRDAVRDRRVLLAMPGQTALAPSCELACPMLEQVNRYREPNALNCRWSRCRNDGAGDRKLPLTDAARIASR